jgi:hypothetical protein
MIDLMMIVRDSAGSSDGGKRQAGGDVETHIGRRSWMNGEGDWKAWCCSGVEMEVEEAPPSSYLYVFKIHFQRSVLFPHGAPRELRDARRIVLHGAI